MPSEREESLSKQSVTESRYEKARKKEQAIRLVEKKGVAVERAFLRYGFKISHYSYPRILARYKSRGIEGLVDTRGGAKSNKITDDIKTFIRSIKNESTDLSAAEICAIVQKRFSVSTHFSHMSRILLDMGLSNPVGRPAKEELLEQKGIDHAGCFILKAACLAMNLFDTVVEVILARLREIEINKQE